MLRQRKLYPSILSPTPIAGLNVLSGETCDAPSDGFGHSDDSPAAPAMVASDDSDWGNADIHADTFLSQQ